MNWWDGKTKWSTSLSIQYGDPMRRLTWFNGRAKIDTKSRRTELSARWIIHSCVGAGALRPQAVIQSVAQMFVLFKSNITKHVSLFMRRTATTHQECSSKLRCGVYKRVVFFFFLYCLALSQIVIIKSIKRFNKICMDIWRPCDDGHEKMVNAI